MQDPKSYTLSDLVMLSVQLEELNRESQRVYEFFQNCTKADLKKDIKISIEFESFKNKTSITEFIVQKEVFFNRNGYEVYKRHLHEKSTELEQIISKLKNKFKLNSEQDEQENKS